MFKDIFIQLGLTANEAVVYEFLLKNGDSPAGKIIEKTPLKRGVVYNALADLIKKELVVEKKKDKVAYFLPNHPEQLRENVEVKEEEVKKAKRTLEANLPSIISSFNLVSGRPGVRYFEGIEGVKKVLDDTLKNNAEKKIRAFSDVAGIAKYLGNWNSKYYAPKRLEFGIHEQVIIPNNSEALEFMKGYKANDVTEVLFIDHQLFPFATEVNIYDGKASFVTFSEKNSVGIIIENKEIYDTLVSIFDFAWTAGKPFSKDVQPAWIERYDGGK